MSAKEAALARLEAAVADKVGIAAHDHGGQGLSFVAAQDIATVAAGLTDEQCVALRAGAAGALAGLPADIEPLMVMQKTWQVRHLIETAKG